METKLAGAATRLLGAMAIAMTLSGGTLSCAPKAFGGIDEGDAASDDGEWGSSAAPVLPRSGGAPLQGVATFTAADVAAIVRTHHEQALALGRLASEHGTAVEVKTYALRVESDRAAAAVRMIDLQAGLGPRSADATSMLLGADTERTRDALTELSGSDFDLPFMTAELINHARLLGLLDTALLPSMTKAVKGAAGTPSEAALRALEAELFEVRTKTEAQMIHALRVQGVLRAARGPSDDAVIVAGAGSATGGDAPR
jgi:predicted outer membrane protein